MPVLTVNGRPESVDAPNDTPLLWIIREQLQMTGTKFGCGAGLAAPAPSTWTASPFAPARRSSARVVGKKITTIEGLSAHSDHPLAEGLGRRAGAAVRLLPVRPDHAGGLAAVDNPAPTRAEIVENMNGNLCRCMTYPRIVKAIERAANDLRASNEAQGAGRKA